MKAKESLVVEFNAPPVTLGTYHVTVDTEDGYMLKAPYLITLRLVSRFIRRGNWEMFNGI